MRQSFETRRAPHEQLHKYVPKSCYSEAVWQRRDHKEKSKRRGKEKAYFLKEQRGEATN